MRLLRRNREPERFLDTVTRSLSAMSGGIRRGPLLKGGLIAGGGAAALAAASAAISSLRRRMEANS